MGGRAGGDGCMGGCGGGGDVVGLASQDVHHGGLGDHAVDGDHGASDGGMQHIQPHMAAEQARQGDTSHGGVMAPMEASTNSNDINSKGNGGNSITHNQASNFLTRIS